MSIIANKKAFHDYFIEERFEAGIALQGWEVKAIRAGRANIKESYVVIRSGEVFLFGMHITALPEASTQVTPDPFRTRKLLLHKREIRKLNSLSQTDGYSLIPTRLYIRDGLVKVELAVAKGKKLYDKRHTMAERDAKRDMDRRMKSVD